MDKRKIDQLGYYLFGKGYLYFNVFLDVIDYCKELIRSTTQPEKLDFEESDEWKEFIKWRSRHDSNVRPLDS